MSPSTWWGVYVHEKRMEGAPDTPLPADPRAKDPAFEVCASCPPRSHDSARQGQAPNLLHGLGEAGWVNLHPWQTGRFWHEERLSRPQIGQKHAHNAFAPRGGPQDADHGPSGPRARVVCEQQLHMIQEGAAGRRCAGTYRSRGNGAEEAHSPLDLAWRYSATSGPGMARTAHLPKCAAS